MTLEPLSVLAVHVYQNRLGDRVYTLGWSGVATHSLIEHVRDRVNTYLKGLPSPIQETPLGRECIRQYANQVIADMKNKREIIESLDGTFWTLA